jgi:hypothetical protein
MRENGPRLRGALPSIAGCRATAGFAVPCLLQVKGENVKTTTPMGAIAALVLASAALPAHADHVRRTYEVVVQSSAGATFTDCLRFDQPQSTVLTIDRLGSILYTHGGLGNRLNRFKGVGAAGNDAIAFFGSFKRKFRRISGEAVTNVRGGVALVFSGRRREGCVRSSIDSASGASGSPYFEAE